MLICLNWLRDFVNLPPELDLRELAERLTMVTAEVEGVQRVSVSARGLVVAEVLSAEAMAGTRDLFRVEVGTGGKPYGTVTAAMGLAAGRKVVYAPPGAHLPGVGPVGRARVAGEESCGMIVPGQAVGITQAAQQAVFLPPGAEAGAAIDVAALEDWVIEIDNKAITHRPDLWGHYGVAREVAAIYGVALRPYEAFITPLEELSDRSLPEIPIVIDEPQRCPRYSALMMEGLAAQPSPLLIQARLSHVGMRPIDLIVDLTNYIMAELGQPMHAFDGGRVDRIEVGLAKRGERFATLDGVERVMPEGALMIQSHRKRVAVAGIMGGAETEVGAQTTRVLLESANFEAATIRRCAAALGHRTEASARFEKSLDPNSTVLGIGRFVRLAREELGGMRLASRLSDCYPKKLEPACIDVDLTFMERFLGRPVPPERVREILEALEFEVQAAGAERIRVRVPSFRATRDVTIEADVIEEVARFVGYETIEPRLPAVHLRRYEPNALHRLERRSLELLCGAPGFAEIQSYVWYDSAWLATLGVDPGVCVRLRNPPAAGLADLRQTLMPDLLGAVERNRHHLDCFSLLEVGSVFLPGGVAGREGDVERRHLGLACVERGRGAVEDRCLERLKAAIECWAEHVLERTAEFAAASRGADGPWEHRYKSADVVIADRRVGGVTVVPEALKGAIHEHLRGWSIALGEVCLDAVLAVPAAAWKLPAVPVHPQVRLDFSILVGAERSFVQIHQVLQRFSHPLLRRLTFRDSYQGPPLPPETRSLTLRAWIGHGERTLTEEDRREFATAFEGFLRENGLALRS